jgi:hypothetical protein
MVYAGDMVTKGKRLKYQRKSQQDFFLDFSDGYKQGSDVDGVAHSGYHQCKVFI